MTDEDDRGDRDDSLPDGNDRDEDVAAGVDGRGRDEDLEPEGADAGRESDAEREGSDAEDADDAEREGDDAEDADDAEREGDDDLDVTVEGEPDDPDRKRPLAERLHELATDLLEAGRVEGSGRGRRISYGYSARTGPGRPSSPPRRRSRGRRTTSRTGRPDAHATVERDGNDLRVAVDVPGVDPDELTVGVDPESAELVVAVADRVLVRVPLEGADVVEDASLNNDVLTVHLTAQ